MSYIVLMRCIVRSFFLALAMLAVGTPALAQDQRREPVECRGQRVSETRVYTRPPFAPSGSGLIDRTGRAASRLHHTTRPSVVRRFLLLRVGDRCTELGRMESERILWAQPFIADASVRAYADGPDSVILEVTTTDEIAAFVDGSISGGSPHLRVLRVGHRNVFGGGVSAYTRWEAGRGFRDGYGAGVTVYQLFGRRDHIAVEAGRNPLGHAWSIEASQPFLTDLQRVSWRASYGVIDDYAFFRRSGDTAVALSLRRSAADMGGVFRIGGPGRLALVGASLSHESDAPGSEPVLLDRGRIDPDTSQALMNRYSHHRQTRVNLLLGFRDLRFLPVTGFDALDGVQYVRRGWQLSGLAGKGVDIFDRGSANGVFVSAAFYGGMGTQRAFAALDAMIGGHHDRDEDRWQGVIASARVGAYARTSARNTLVSSLEWTAGWRSRIPFQLTFADREGGLRGFAGSRVGGGRRMILRLEDRYFHGHYRRSASIGFAVFIDAGQLWAGDAPFGVDSRLSASAGVALLAAAPPRSQRLLRLEAAYPINPDAGRYWVARLTATDVTRYFWREPRDVRNARERSVPSNVFNWP